MSNTLKHTQDLILEMHSDKIFFASDYPDTKDNRSPKDIEDLYEFIDRVREDMSLTFAEKVDLIENKQKELRG
ncbi:MAG: hypothetical protein H8D97_01020 [Proteobacteria bacterium]|nr:hypothetical protein [Pseudomonadota bacterium]